MHWYILNLGLSAAAGVYLWLTHPNWGRIKNTNPRRKPERNPPIWAKLSTCGRIPTAKLSTMMTRRVSNAATWTLTQSCEITWVKNVINQNDRIILQAQKSSKRSSINTLLEYNVQFVMSSESIAPSKPKSAPEAPTEMFDWMKRPEKILPPNPEMTYINPIRTVIKAHKHQASILSYTFCI